MELIEQLCFYNLLIKTSSDRAYELKIQKKISKRRAIIKDGE